MMRVTSLVLITTLILSPLTSSLPLHEAPNNQGSNTLEPRRMIPSATDLFSRILASLGVEEFNKFNQLNPDDNNDSASTDDSHSATHTVTSQENNEGAKPSGAVKVDEHVDEEGESESAAQAPVEGEDAVEDPQGFMDRLFEALRKKFREEINSSDEITL
ncbi:hypothetical protein BJX63DRAFT_429500 [Aspergillus granulosus]|uniref:Uncharacterized protein n=1 Tax=Aspergillus granulosus TaxID=176169 RepID=A0ABR4HQN8_9EURO